jgi:WD40 repeat protein
MDNSIHSPNNRCFYVLLLMILISSCVPSKLTESPTRQISSQIPLETSSVNNNIDSEKSITPEFTSTYSPTATPQSPKITSSTISNISILAEWDLNYLTGIKWSPDNTRIAIATHDGIYFVDMSTLKTQLFKHDPLYWYSDIDFSPDGSVLAATDGIRIILWDISKVIVINELSDDVCQAGDWIAYHPDGQFLASGITEGTYAGDYTTSIYLWDLEKGRCSPLVEDLKGYLDEFSFSLDGHYLLNADATNSKTYLWDIDTLDIVCISEGSIAAISSANNLLAVSNYNDPDINLIDISSCNPVDTLTKSSFSNDIAFSPDGFILAGAGYGNIKDGEDQVTSRIAFWDVLAREIVHDIEDLPITIEKILFSPDGKYFISVIHIDSPDALYRFDLWGVDN